MKKIKVEITRNCIKRGSRSNPSYCPIALAVDKYLNKYYTSSVGINGEISVEYSFAAQLGLLKNSKPISIVGSPKRRWFIRKFDNTDNPKTSIKPFSFVIKLPKEVLKPQYK